MPIPRCITCGRPSDVSVHDDEFYYFYTCECYYYTPSQKELCDDYRYGELTAYLKLYKELQKMMLMLKAQGIPHGRETKRKRRTLQNQTLEKD